MCSVNDIFLFGSSFDDVEYPVQPPFITVALHVWADMSAVDVRCFVDGADALGGVLGDVLYGAGVDKIEL